MRKWGALAIGGVLLISLATPVNAAAPKAGATCTKKNATATSAGKIYTCILSGKKLVWSKGVTISKVSVENKAPDVVDEKNLLAIDPRITPASQLSSIDICKTEDMTPDFREGIVRENRNGFPRPALAVSNQKSAKILVIPMSFLDLPFQVEKVDRGQVITSDLLLLNEVIPNIKSSYDKLSGGRFNVTIDVLPKSEWWILDMKTPFSSTWGVSNIGSLMEIVNTKKPEFKFDGYDTFAFITGNGMPGQSGIGPAQAAFGEKVKNSKSGTMNALLMTGSIGGTAIWVHELGHSLFAFEDLYLFNQAGVSSQRAPEISVPNKWDLMADARAITLLEWNKLLSGWSYNSEIRCLTDQKTSVHYLSNIPTSTHPKIITINLAPGVTLAAETSTGGVDGTGLLLYLINTYIPHGEGPILSQNKLVSKGESRSWQGWQFNVIGSDNKGLLVEVIKTDKDKFVPPEKKPSPSQPNLPVSKIVVSRGDVISTGYLKGRATWTVQGQQSFRTYVTAVDDFQKVYFESGFVNDSGNPLVVEISGLICNKELRTVTEFYSEKDGKGERLVIESKQLSFLSCEDTTKKS